MKRLLCVIIPLCLMTSCGIRNKIAKYTGIGNDSLGISEQSTKVEKPISNTNVKITEVVEQEDKLVTIKVENVEPDSAEQIIAELSEPVVKSETKELEIKPDTNYNFILYLIGGLLVVYLVLRFFIKRSNK